MNVEGRWSSGRTEAFSDAVFAIAITLLVLEIHVPEDAFDDLARGIIDQWPFYLAYVTSFLTIGGIWLAHHEVFSRLEHVNNHLMRLNLLLLMAVSFLPFPTGLVAGAINDRHAERTAVLFYGGALCVVSLLFSALWATARLERLLRSDVTDADITAITRATAPNIAFYVAASLVALVAPTIAALAYLVIAVTSILRSRGDTVAPDLAPPRERVRS